MQDFDLENQYMGVGGGGGGVILNFCSVFYNLIKHGFSSNQSARYIWTLL